MSLLNSKPRMRRPNDTRAIWFLSGVALGAALTLFIFWVSL